jgi:3D (Asp-Asp-Asp) domain-containing protein
MKCVLLFKNNATDYDLSKATFRADDTGGSIKGKRIDIYLGEGQSAWDKWLQSGGNRYVDIYYLPSAESGTG